MSRPIAAYLVILALVLGAALLTPPIPLERWCRLAAEAGHAQLFVLSGCREALR